MEMRDRVLDALRGDGDGDAPAGVFTQTATVSVMQDSGHSWPLAHSDSKEMAALALQAHTRFGFPTVRVPFDVTVEAEGLRCVVDLGDVERYPSIISRPFESDIGLPSVCHIPDPEQFASSGRRAVICEAVESLAGQGDFVVTAGVLGPFTTLVQVFGADVIVMATLLEPDVLKYWVDSVEPCLLEYARRVSEAGAEVLLLNEGSLSPDITSPSDFSIYAGDRVRRFCFPETITGLHVCGDTTAILKDMSLSGAGFLSIDSKVDPGFAVSTVGTSCPLIGAVDPMNTLLLGSPDDVRREALLYADSGFSVIAPGCGVPPATRDENLYALARYRE